MDDKVLALELRRRILNPLEESMKIQGYRVHKD